MAAGAKTNGKILACSKYLGLALIAVGVPIMIVDGSGGSELPLLIGLFTLLITSSNVEDERSVQTKTTSLYFAFIIAYAAKLLITNLHDHTLITFELIEINHFLILMLTLANTIYYVRMFFSSIDH